MGVLNLLAILGLLGLVTANLENCTFEDISPSGNLTWCSCDDAFFYAKLQVPLDYQKSNLGQASIPLIKYPAVSNSSDGPYQGMILIHPGGPGASGVNEARSNASTIQAIIGTNWDIIGFDPRGIWLSEPVANCSANTTSDQDTMLKARFVPRVTDEFYNSYIEFGKELGERCEKATGGKNDAGPHMTTAVTARDMLSIVDAFANTTDGGRASKPHNLLNYYGLSYGTFLGQTFASMFPERVGNMILDGVVNPEGYLTSFSSACPFYIGSSPMDIYERFNRSFVQLKPREAEAKNWSNATDLEAALLILKATMLGVSYSPLSEFGLLPEILQGLEESIAAHDVRPWTAQLTATMGDPGPSSAEYPEWSLGILCADQNTIFYNKTLEDLKPQIEELEGQSIIGEIWNKAVLACTGWSIKSNDVFAGPFGGDTATPILFVSNTYDPVTPIENALSLAPRYNNSQVLTIDGLGHSSTAVYNYCGFAKMRAYFQATLLPGNDSFCPLENGPFGITLNGTLKENLLKANLTDLVQ